MIKNIFSFLSIFSLIFLAGCGGSSGGNSSPTPQPPASNPTVTLTSYTSETVAQQASVSPNVLKIVTSDINSPEVTSVSFKVSTQGGFETFSFDMNNISINGNMPTSITDDILVFDNSFQSFSNNEWVLNIDSIIEEFRGFGGIIQLDEIEISLKDSANKEYISEKTSFTLTIEKNVDFSSLEFIQHNSRVSEETLIAQVKAASDIALCDGYLDLHFGKYNPELAGTMYNPNTPDNPLVLMNQIDLSLLESVIIINNLTQEEHIFYGSENMTMIGIPIDMTSHDNHLDFSIYVTKVQGANLTNIGIAQNLRGFNDCYSENSLHQNRWKYLETPVSFYDSEISIQRLTEDQSSIVIHGEEVHTETYVLSEQICETCPEGSTLNSINYRYEVEHVDILNSQIKIAIKGVTQYEGMIVLNSENQIVFTPNDNVIIKTEPVRLDVYVTAYVNGNPAEPRLGIHPVSITYVTAGGITITDTNIVYSK